MANLRANKITTGTADYQGSIYANGVNAYLLTTTTAPGTDDFTIECWINSDAASSGTQEGVFAINAVAHGFQSGASNQLRLAQGRDGTDGQNGGLEVNLNGTYVGTGDGNDIIQEGTWHHIAVTRASGTVKIWVDGVEKASGSAAGDVTGTTFITGYYDGNYTYQGYMSNFRYRKGTAHYTTTFTPPTGPLERTSDTELLFAQSVNNAGDGYSSAIHGGTTNIMQVFGNVTANTSAPTLTTTSDVGVVFDGDTKVNSQSYMYFPTGDTSQRGRGRGLFGGGYSPQNINVIQYLEIQSMGNTMDFGDLSDVHRGVAGFGSKTRGVFSGGSGGSPTGSTLTNKMEYVTISNTANALDFGDMVSAARNVDGCSNSTRGILFGGQLPSAMQNVIQYSTIASTGDATNFGDLTREEGSATAFASSTRAIHAGGFNWSGVADNVIEYITIATTGDATNFGDLLGLYAQQASVASSTRGVVFTGSIGPTPSNNSNVIQYVTIASTGDATDFGDNTGGAWENARGVTNSLRGVFAGGYQPNWGNAIYYITITNTGNSLDFGDLIPTGGGSGLSQAGNTSDSHGGLS